MYKMYPLFWETSLRSRRCINGVPVTYNNLFNGKKGPESKEYTVYPYPVDLQFTLIIYDVDRIEVHISFVSYL